MRGYVQKEGTLVGISPKITFATKSATVVTPVQLVKLSLQHGDAAGTALHHDACYSNMLPSKVVVSWSSLQTA